jgi:hypothetical protein
MRTCRDTIPRSRDRVGIIKAPPVPPAHVAAPDNSAADREDIASVLRSAGVITDTVNLNGLFFGKRGANRKDKPTGMLARSGVFLLMIILLVLAGVISLFIF